MIRQFELIEMIKAYDPKVDEELINRAYVYAMKAHGSQTRASGDPYFSHPLEVAGILTSMKLDQNSIVTALLHDTIEDTVATPEKIEELFGEEIARLVDGVTKLSQIELQSDHTQEAENFRKLLLAMSEDIRVLLVKLADRLHNMRTLKYIKNPDKRRRIAKETADIYAPLAERIGLHNVKDELEDLAFSEINAEARDSVLARLEFLREQGGNLAEEIITELMETLKKGGVDALVTGREKSPFSIWSKMQRKHIPFEQLADIIAFRVVVDDVDSCYKALGIFHGAYPVVPGRFKDYISTPKRNGYSSIHTCVLGPARNRIEIQIRTHEMHEIAERGVAAHWQYKQGDQAAREGSKFGWLQELLHILDQAAGPEEFLEHTKLEMYADQVFCFTPLGELISLPRGGTPVDFAYAVHSNIGNTCVGAKINGRLMPLDTQLENGDQVEIVVSKAQSPSPTWESFVVTGKARVAIRRFVRSRQVDEYAYLGRAILEKIFDEFGYEYSDKALNGVLKIFRQDSALDLIAAVGSGVVTAREVLGAVFPGLKEEIEAGTMGKVVPLSAERKKRKKKEKGYGVPIRGLTPGMALHYAHCCHPLPGDRIVGILTTGKGVTIHTIDCDTLESFSEMPERWLDVSWDLKQAQNQVGRINVTVINEPGALSSLSTVIAKNSGNILNLKITNRSTDFFEMAIDVEVESLKHLSNIIAALRATPAINSVERARG
ncbi:MAG: bifunctional (p)ppGpp synthetase/guanosine-3',5'-bis(diphosphate) 3'-pyrophosphohydrolase [Rhodospirillales bacterium]|jgi:GTP pyrophosphokinase|nr:bifunctional (p)ppGpp synthetase/guanosine-3',5'-bis(diphosphate) 3'-pyrophosphohydrolase [Rhodospirillales bacterium]MBT4007166.1 bifunctional (p)ppGpp synthetase/guanosine-3',5'-bis(diphosphate) 3'-pyrophosphohydrolase [Rhodospirillales bacterium]MBT5076655.1 bifunctional (p)ppGpp synthetase/guanosine-3',5'-bis(diphosphate) 3'-pyrophosphohydrolase [Rhodospirillales bacterium]MBT5113499.1 bifunctional (p)ppGpp synthetase/guanosine-3',5'-bis(diphosphate) 3'-pyrophosphohydrolase [Rhodospirilla